MHEVKLSSKNQIVVPREARAALHVEAGDRLLVVVRRDTVILVPKPKKYSKAISGLARRRYPAEYVKRERSNWR